MLGLVLITILVGSSTGLKRIELRKEVIYRNNDLTIPTTTNQKPLQYYNHQQSDFDEQQPIWDHNPKQPIQKYNQYQPILDWNQQQQQTSYSDQQQQIWDRNQQKQTWDSNQRQPEWDWNLQKQQTWDVNHQQQTWDPDQQQSTWNWNHQKPTWNSDHQQQTWDWNQQKPTWDLDHQQQTLDWNQQKPTWDSDHQQQKWDWNQHKPTWDSDQQQQTWDWNQQQQTWNSDQEQSKWDWNQQQQTWDSDQQQSTWDWTTEITVLKISLSVWDQVEERFRDLLLSAVQTSTSGLRDPSTRAAGVMFTVAKLAAKLAGDCSRDEYARTYMQIVRSNLMQAVRSPQVAIQLVTKLLNEVSRNTKQIRELLNVKMPNGKEIRKNLKKLEREKHLAVALGTLAFGAFSSYPLKKAIRDDEVIQYMVGPSAQDKLYPLVVKTAQVLQLVSNRQTCELEDPFELDGELNDDDTSDTNDESSFDD